MKPMSLRPANIPLPYFDFLLEQLNQGEPMVQQAFGRHVHWGYWPYPKQADGSVEDFAIASERLCQRVIAAAGVKEGDRVLDVGCGFGGTIASLNEQFHTVNLTGLNIDPRQLARARQTIKPLNQNQIEFVEADACQMPFADASMDVVLAVECIFHFPSRVTFFQEARRVLRPGGRLGLCDFVSTPFFQALQNVTAQLGVKLANPVYGRVDSSFTLSDYKILACETGFSLRLQEDITRNTLPTYPVVCHVFEQMNYSKAVKATATAGLLSRLGLLRYQILSFAIQN
jgi:ubiquinone/menaquinone biosynthesis C-methylase UbiE